MVTVKTPAKAVKYVSEADKRKAQAAQIKRDETNNLLAKYAPNYQGRAEQEDVVYPGGKKDQPIRAGEGYFVTKAIDKFRFGPGFGGALNTMANNSKNKTQLKDAVKADEEWDKYFRGVSLSSYKKQFETEKKKETVKRAPAQQRATAATLGSDTLIGRYGL